MTFKHYDVVRRHRRQTLLMHLRKKFVKDGSHTAGRFLRIRMMRSTYSGDCRRR